VHVTTKLNRSHVVHGREALILPCLGRTEIDMQANGPQGVTVEDSMSMVHISMGINPPASEHLLSEPAIVARLAAATIGARSKTPWLWLIEDYARIRDKIEAVFDDFKDFNTRVAHPGGFRLRNTASERVWATASKKAVFFTHAVPLDTHVAPCPRALREEGRHHRLHAAHHALARPVQHHHLRHGRPLPRRVRPAPRGVHPQAEDIRALGMKDGDWVDIQTVWSDGQERRADRFKLVAYDIPRGNLAAYYPETNPLVPLSSVAENAGTPTSKSIPVVLTPHAVPAPEARLRTPTPWRHDRSGWLRRRFLCCRHPACAGGSTGRRSEWRRHVAAAAGQAAGAGRERGDAPAHADGRCGHRRRARARLGARGAAGRPLGCAPDGHRARAGRHPAG
jgi:anaerobic selenocysteine-containing dehydrogenase